MNVIGACYNDDKNTKLMSNFEVIKYEHLPVLSYIFNY